MHRFIAAALIVTFVPCALFAQTPPPQGPDQAQPQPQIEQPQQQAGPTIEIGPATPPAPPPNGAPWTPPPGQIVAPQPMVAQPIYPVMAGPDPAYLRYSEHERATRRLIVGGAVIFGAMYLLTVAVGLAQASSTYSYQQTEGWLNVIPVAGPFINAVRVAGSGGSGSGPAVFVYFTDGIVQAGGLIMLIAGVARHQSPPPPGMRASAERRRAHWDFLPFAAGATAGATVSLTTF